MTLWAYGDTVSVFGRKDWPERVCGTFLPAQPPMTVGPALR